tara:strand:- start:247 stop:888 length:642 start_codon:yes stop_codon:yes gene_type:complete
MSSNQHSLITDPHIHNPKGYETAPNGTVMTKGISVSGYNDGALEWIPQTKIGATNYELQGYVTGASNYFKGEDIANTRSPYLFGEDYGASTITTGVSTIDNSIMFRTGMNFHVVSNSTVKLISGYITSNGSNNVQIAICKVTPTSSSSPHVIDLIDVITVAGGGGNDILVSFSETVFLADTLSAGDIVFPMIREDGGTGSSIYLKGTIQTICY